MLTVTERLDRLTAALTAAQLQKSDYGPSGGPSKGKGKGGGKGRKVASEAGARRYGLPIGAPLGQGKPKPEKDAYDRFMSQGTPADLTRSAQWMSNDDLKTTAKAVFGVVSINPRNEAARIALVKELAQRGISPHSLGYKGGHVALNPNPKEDPVAKKARQDKAKTDREAKATASQREQAAKKLDQAAKQAEREAEREKDRIKRERDREQSGIEQRQRAFDRLPKSEQEFWRQRGKTSRNA